MSLSLGWVECELLRCVCYSLVCGVGYPSHGNLLICDPTTTDLTSPSPTRTPSFPSLTLPPSSSLCPVVIQNVYGKPDMTALHWAAQKGSKECAEVLLDKGADVMATTKVSSGE